MAIASLNKIPIPIYTHKCPVSCATVKPVWIPKCSTTAQESLPVHIPSTVAKPNTLCVHTLIMIGECFYMYVHRYSCVSNPHLSVSNVSCPNKYQTFSFMLNISCSLNSVIIITPTSPTN